MTTDLEESYFVDRVLKVMYLAPCSIIDPSAFSGFPIPIDFWGFLIQNGVYNLGGPGWNGPTGGLALVCGALGEPACTFMRLLGEDPAYTIFGIFHGYQMAET